jgi:hypothetical protein
LKKNEAKSVLIGKRLGRAQVKAMKQSKAIVLINTNECSIWSQGLLHRIEDD